MKTSISTIISRIRTQVKGVRQDSLLTDRVIYSFILKNAKWLMKREDGRNKLGGYSSIVQTMDYVELIEVDKVEACCTGIKSGCTIKRTRDKMPYFMDGYLGPLIRSITSLDASQELQVTLPNIYLAMSKSTNHRFNKTLYFWFLNEYIYFPNLSWDAVRIEGIFEEDISMYTCSKEDDCVIRSEHPLHLPDYLLGELEAAVFKDLAGMLQIPADTANDKQNITR